MTMTETPTTPTKPKAKRKPARRKPAARATPVEVPTEFEGMTAADCCDACEMTHCVITGIGICGHPMKGGLQAPLMVKPEVVSRFRRAKKVLAHAKLELRDV